MVTTFNWFIERGLAGSGLPGLFSPIEEEMEFLREQGIGLVVTLTENPLPHPPEDFGIESIHFPIPDMAFPMPRNTLPLCERIVETIRGGDAVLLHCKAGLGRTGTIGACCLVYLGRTPEEAITELRMLNSNYIQTTSQEMFVSNFAKYMAEQEGDGGEEKQCA